MPFQNCSDIELLSLMIYGEARGESVVGKLAVARVAMNRAARPGWWGHSLRDVILAPKQFSCFNPDDPNYTILRGMAETKRFNQVCLVVSEMAIRGITTDPSGGATHYCTVDLHPAWEKAMDELIRIGNHKFFREK